MAMAEIFMTSYSDPTEQDVCIEKAKYNAMRSAILENLQLHGAMTSSQLGRLVENCMQADLDGLVLWHYTTVKLDLEARGEIRRVPGSRPQLIEAVN